LAERLENRKTVMAVDDLEPTSRRRMRTNDNRLIAACPLDVASKFVERLGLHQVAILWMG
jgi:hypothetical protein